MKDITNCIHSQDTNQLPKA